MKWFTCILVVATSLCVSGARDLDQNTNSVLYGHGMGYKEVLNVLGFRLKDVLSEHAALTPEREGSSIIVASAKDGYRVVFSASEIMNRNDNHDYLLNDLKDQSSGGRYTLVVTPDYFADRDVRSVEKIAVVDID